MLNIYLFVVQTIAKLIIIFFDKVEKTIEPNKRANAEIVNIILHELKPIDGSAHIAKSPIEEFTIVENGIKVACIGINILLIKAQNVKLEKRFSFQYILIILDN